jgi:hypothetical protein
MNKNRIKIKWSFEPPTYPEIIEKSPIYKAQQNFNYPDERYFFRGKQIRIILDSINYYEVIGNIYDNPELIGGTK